MTRKKATASEILVEIIKQRPQLAVLFRNPELLRPCMEDGNARVSDYLMENIALLFSANDIDFTLRHYPGKGWSAGAVIDSGLRGAEFELLAEPDRCHRFPGHAMLGLLWAMVDECRWNPVVMTRGEFVARLMPTPRQVHP